MFLQYSFRPLARGAFQLLLFFPLLLMLSGCNWLKRASVNSDGEQSNGFTPSAAVLADGGYVAFQSSGCNLSDIDVAWDDVFVFDTVTNTTELISVNSAGDPGNEGSFSPEISGNGRYVTFHSLATNLAANDSNGDHDIFVHDRHTTPTTDRLLLASFSIARCYCPRVALFCLATMPLETGIYT
ncbi:MAG: hypothetical protein ACI9JM_002560 [Halioglobus sp.]|jgi:hypothetical protein